MTRYRYDGQFKMMAVRRVVEHGQPVTKVAADLGVSEGSVFFWVRRYREMAARQRSAFGQHSLNRESLVWELRKNALLDALVESAIENSQRSDAPGNPRDFRDSSLIALLRKKRA